VAQLFDDEVLSVVLRFSNPNRGDMVDADKMASKLSMSLDGVLRRGLSAGKTVDDVAEALKRLEPVLKSFEKRAGNIGTVSNTLRLAQQILSRYTPSRLEKMAETAASRVAETSGTAALRKQLEKHGDLIRRQIATQEGRYESATRGSNVGRGLFIDTESTGLNALKHQITELTATLFTFNKATGEIINEAERTYHGFQQLAFQSKHQYLPSGVTAATLQGQAISTTIMRRMLEQADFVVAHNAPHDKRFVEKIIPEAASKMWLDSMRGIPWKTLGFNSRAQQDLLRGHGIDPGQAHRSTSDVTSAIRLLAARPPIGGPTHLSMLLGNQGPLNVQQQTMALVKQLGEEIRGSLQERLGESRRSFSTVKYAPTTSRESVIEHYGVGSPTSPLVGFARAPIGALGGVPRRTAMVASADEQYLQRFGIRDLGEGITARARRPAHSTDYGLTKGSGQSPEATPGQLGQAAVALDRRIGVIDEFLRNMSTMTGPASAGMFMEVYSHQQEYQEKNQQARGRGRQIKQDIRGGDELTLATMQGTNTQLANRRDLQLAGAPTRNITDSLFDELERVQKARRDTEVSQMLAQPWARPQKSVYVAGPMRGYPELNYPAFHQAAADWRSRDWKVTNPAEIDEKIGFDKSKATAAGTTGPDFHAAMSRDLPAVAGAHAIALLPGWQKSAGATTELERARNLGLQVFDAHSHELLEPGRGYSPAPFSEAEISDFISKHTHQMGRGGFIGNVEAIRPAAQMATHVGRSDPRFQQLTSIMLQGQMAGRQIAEERAAQAQAEAIARLSGPKMEGAPRPRFRNVIGEATKSGFNLGSERGSTPIFGEFADWITKKFRGNKATADQQDRILSYDERARMPLPEPETLKGSIRRDALEQKLKKLEDAVQSTANVFEHYRDVVAPVKAEQAAQRYQARESSIDFSRVGSGISLDAQAQRLEDRKTRGRINANRKLAGVQENFESRSSGLGLNELEAEGRYDSALRRRSVAMRRAAQKYDVSDFSRIPATKRNQISEELDARVRPAELNLMRAQFKRQSAQVTDPEQLEQLRQSYASQASITRYGAGTGTVRYLGQDRSLEDLRQEYAQRTLESVGGRTLAQKSESKAGEIAQDQLAAERQLESQLAQNQTRRSLSEEKFNQQRQQNAAKLGVSLGKINDDVEQKGQKLIKKRVDSESKAHEAKVKFLKGEDALGAGRGGAGGGAAGGGGGRGGLFGDAASRTGYGFGIGLPALVALDAGIKEVIKDSAIYASKIQMMEFATAQMAKVNGLNVGQVNAEVEALKKHNITTEEANSVVQKLMLTNQDLAKATQLVTVAQDLAAVSGTDAMQTVERLMTAITTGYTRNLHMMGLQVTMVSAMRDLRIQRKAQGLTGEPTEADRREALINQITQQGAKFAGTYEKSLMTAGGQFAYLRKEVLETSNVIGKEFLPQFGNVVNFLTGGLHYVQGNAQAFAHLTSVLASVGVAANALGSVKFIQWMIGGSGPIPLPFKVAALAASALTYTVLNRDKGESMTANKDAAIQRLKDQIADLTTGAAQTRSAMRTAPKGEQDNLANSLKYQETAIASAYHSIEDIEKQHTDNLANLYLERVENQKKYYEDISKDLPWYKQLLQGVMTGVIPTPEFTKGKGIRGFHIEKEPLFGEGFNESGVRVPGKDKAEQDIVKKRASDLLKERARVAGLPPTLRNQQARDDSAMSNTLSDMQAKIATLDEKTFAGEGDALRRRFERGMQTPRERIEAQRQIELYPIKNAGKIVEYYQKRVKETLDPEKQKEYQSKLDEANETLANQKDLTGEVNKDASAAYGKLSSDKAADIAQIKAQIEIEKIRANTIEGSYASERQAILSTFDVNQQTAKKTLALKHDIDAYDKQVADNEAERDKALISLDANRRRAMKGLGVRKVQREADVSAEDIMNAPGDAEDAIRQSFAVRQKAALAEPDDVKRAGQQQDLQFELNEALKNLGRSKLRLGAETRVTQFEDSQDMAEQLDEILNPTRGKRTEVQEGLERITRTHARQTQSALNRYAEFQPITPAADQDALKSERDEALRKADQQSSVDKVKLLKDQQEAAGGRLAENYKQELQSKEQIAKMSASETADEMVSAANLHSLRLEYIEKEYAARGKTLDAEKTKTQDILEVESNSLDAMYESQKKQFEGLQSFGASLFQTVSTDHARGLRDMLLGQVRGLGATVFGNVFADVFKHVKLNLPDSALYTTDPTTGNKTPTKLGQYLGKTPLGTKVATDDEIKKQEQVVMGLQKDAEEDNTRALRDLTAALDQARSNLSSLSGTSTAGMSRLPGLPGLPGAMGQAASGLSVIMKGARQFGLPAGTAPGTYFNLPAAMPSISLPDLLQGVAGASGIPGQASADQPAPPGAVDVKLSYGGVDEGPSSQSWTTQVGVPGGTVPGGAVPGGGFSGFGGLAGFGGSTAGGGANIFSYGGAQMSPDIVMPPSAPGTPEVAAAAAQALFSHLDVSKPSTSTVAATIATAKKLAQEIGQVTPGARTLPSIMSPQTPSFVAPPGGYNAAGQGLDVNGNPIPFTGPTLNPQTGQMQGYNAQGQAVDDNGNSIPFSSSSTMGTVQQDIGAAAMVGAGTYQAATEFGKGARGDFFAAGGILSAGAGVAMLAGQPEIAAPLEIASMGAELTGGFFLDPKTKRANQIANYLGANTYLGPAQLDMTTDLQGNLVSEGKGGLASDTGIGYNALQITPPELLQYNPNPSFLSGPWNYLFGARPSTYQTAQNFEAPASSYPGAYQDNYTDVPGQVLYNDLPANATPTNFSQGSGQQQINVNVNALDSQSFMDRSADVALALQKELLMGSGVGQTIQNAVFGTG
jgi:DNA polymerase III epsilon subunit-like protein